MDGNSAFTITLEIDFEVRGRDGPGLSLEMSDQERRTDHLCGNTGRKVAKGETRGGIRIKMDLGRLELQSDL